MAFVNQEKKAKFAAALQEVMPKGWKYSLAVRHHSTIVLTIQSAPIDLLAAINKVREPENRARDYADVNHYWLEKQFDGQLLKIFERIKRALNLNNHDNSDIQTDYFDVGHYIDIHVGRYGKPFVVTGSVAAE